MNKDTSMTFEKSGLLYAGIAIIIVAILIGYCAEYYYLMSGCLLLGIICLWKKSLSNNSSAQEELPIFVFKSTEHAFQFICECASFDYDLMPGIVRKSTIVDNLSHVEVECLHENDIYLIENCLNLLGNKVKVNDLVTCFDLDGRVVVGSLLFPKFNPNTRGWKVAATAKYFEEADEIPVIIRTSPRGMQTTSPLDQTKP